MRLIQEKAGEYLIISAQGRLDASWSDYVTETLLDLIRSGHHHLVIEAGGLEFISSAGIRTLVRIYKELQLVNGSFAIVDAPAAVTKVLEMTGFKAWILPGLPDRIVEFRSRQEESGTEGKEVYILDPAATMALRVEGDWQPWKEVAQSQPGQVDFHPSVFALGIGGTPDAASGISPAYGDFLAAGGHVIYQPPEEKARPDFLLAEGGYIPNLSVIQSLVCEGGMSHLYRFAPAGDHGLFTLSALTETVLDLTGSGAAALLLMAETDGLVGAHLVRSPALHASNGTPAYPALRDWLSFTGERAHHGELSLVFGIVARTGGAGGRGWLKALPSMPSLSGHFHAAVFPFQPIQNGKIDLMANLAKLLDGPPPQALLHLVDDDRPAVGLGQSVFIRGACWCAPITQGKEVLS